MKKSLSLNPSGQFGRFRRPVGAGLLQAGLNPSIQIRAVRTFLNPKLWDLFRLGKSQSLNTDQGSSDCGKRRLRSHHGALESQSLNTDQGSSDLYRPLRLKILGDVSIPQYRSGQFGQHPSQITEEPGVKVAVFPASPKAPPFEGRASAFHLFSTSQLLDGTPLRAEVQPVCQNGDLGLACVLSGGRLSVFNEWPSTSKSTPGGSLLQRARWERVRGGLDSLRRYSSAMRPRPKVAPLPTWRISAVRRRVARSSGMSPSRSRVPRRPPRVTLRCWRLL
jgi:hypothetical protein